MQLPAAMIHRTKKKTVAVRLARKTARARKKNRSVVEHMLTASSENSAVRIDSHGRSVPTVNM